ncbi:MAG: DUF1631 family protein [Luteimonas sp.]
MRTPVPPDDRRGQRAGTLSPGQLLEALKRGALARLLPACGEIQAAAEVELRKQRTAGQDNSALDDDLTNLTILRRHATMYERRWQEGLTQGFEGWPRPTERHDVQAGYALLSDDQLHAQLVGQPVIEALKRRFADALDVIDSRLWSLAAELGAQSRPSNPIGARAIVESFLDAFPASECSTTLRQALLRQLERIGGEQFGDMYAWFNAQLAEAGFAMTRAGDYAMLMASPLGGIAAPTEAAIAGKRALWSQDNALDATDSTWRDGKRVVRRVTGGGNPHDAVRGQALRRQARARRAALAADTGGIPPTRELRDEEFLAVLSLLQADASGMRQTDAVSSELGERLREFLRQGAERLGMERAGTAFNVEQNDAIDLTGLVFDRLIAEHALSVGAIAWLERLCCPYVRLAMDDPYLFDDAEHPAQAWLSLLIEQWDANASDNEHDADVHSLGEASAEEVIADYHGDAVVFEDALEALRVALEPRRGRADLAERRLWQSIQGRERLQAARRDADAALAQRLQGRALLASVAGFLEDQWRQSLIHAWLREGPDSERYRAALTVGDTMVGIDEAAARAQGREVAEKLIELQQPLRDCYVACGLDENGANGLLAVLVGDLSKPDALRQRHVPTPSTEDDTEEAIVATDADSARALAAGQNIIGHDSDARPIALRVAWVSPMSSRHLLVTRQGARHSLLLPSEIAAMRENGRLQLRSPDGAIEGVVRALAEAAAERVDETGPG